LDIDASVDNWSADFNMIKNLAIECKMPFCYSGGVSTVDDAKKIVQLRAEKVAFSSGVIQNLQLIKDAISNQSVVVVLDYKKLVYWVD
jgi:cyclase